MVLPISFLALITNHTAKFRDPALANIMRQKIYEKEGLKLREDEVFTQNI